MRRQNRLDTFDDDTNSSSPSQDLLLTIRKILKPLASLQLTVALFCLAMILVFFGTLAQVNESIDGTVKAYFRSFYVQIPLQLLVKFGQKFFQVPETAHLNGSIPFIGGWTLGALLLLNLLSAHALRFKLAWRRTGIFMIHTGMIVLLLGELFTGLTSTEGLLMVENGGRIDYVVDLKNVELAVTKKIDADHDEVTVVPSTVFQKQNTVHHDDLPFDIHLENYYLNSTPPRTLKKDETTVATAGYGLTITIDESPVIAGTDSKQTVDTPAGYFTFIDKSSGANLGTYLCTSWPDSPTQVIKVNGDEYEISLRQKRIYKPYSIQLKKVETTYYPGSDIPKEFSSSLTLFDHETGQHRDYDISMNHPLRHGGETLYQSNILGKDQGTVLQVVKNPAWILPYIACILMTVGMFVHFSLALSKFLKKRALTSSESHTFLRSGFDTYLPYAILGIFVLYAIGRVIPPSQNDTEMDIYRAGLIPVQDSGRIKPLDTLARVDLTIVGKQQEFTTYQDEIEDTGSVRESIFGKPKKSATKWFLDLAAAQHGSGTNAKQHRVIRIDNEQMLNWLKLPLRPGSYRYSLEELRWYEVGDKTVPALRERQVPESILSAIGELKGTRYTSEENFFKALKEQLGVAGLQPLLKIGVNPADELISSFEMIRETATAARRLEEAKRSQFDLDIIRLNSQLSHCFAILDGLTPSLEPATDKNSAWAFPALVDKNLDDEVTDEMQMEIRNKVYREIIAEDASKNGFNPKDVETLPEDLLVKRAEQLLQSNSALKAKSFKRANQLLTAKMEQLRWKNHPQMSAYLDILDAYTIGDPKQFNTAVNTYHENYSSKLPDNQWLKIRLEGLFQRAAPFSFTSVFYIIAFLLGVGSWLGWSDPLRRSAFTLAVGVAVVITLALGVRVFLQGRPPVTNLYSSAIFIGWGCVVTCLCLEKIYANGIAVSVGSLLAVGCNQIAYFLSDNSDTDTMESLRAVLDTNPWLATHVTSVTFGYVATFVAGSMATCIIILGVFTKVLDKQLEATLGKMVYGILCFATLLSFVGTVLGGIWADQSWGRFWGWDPKENGAVLVVIWNALILHARWCGLVKVRGMAVLALFGNMVTAWSWFGTNQLGVGLHAYGFNKGLALGCRIYWLSQIVLIGVGLLPRRFWRSDAEQTILP